MIPQSPANNREVWWELEEYSRDLVSQGKELYIVAGGEGKEKAIALGAWVHAYLHRVEGDLSNARSSLIWFNQNSYSSNRN